MMSYLPIFRLHLCKLPFLYRFARFSPISVQNMSVAAVRSVEGEETLTIYLSYGGKQRHMQRNKGEMLSKALTRIELSSKKKWKSEANSGDTCGVGEVKVENASLWFNGEVVDTSLVNALAWQDGATLKIGNNSFTVAVNPPTIKSLLLPENIMSGFPVMPLIDLEFSSKHYCSYTWFKSTNHVEEQASSAPASPREVLVWEEVGSECLYTPSVLDIGCYLKLCCVAGNADKLSDVTSEVTSSVTVSAGPGFFPFDTRHMYTRKRTNSPGKFRIVSYNILADMYTRDEFARTVLYPYCPSYALGIDYRQHLLLKEITGYNADLICLQECGVKLFQNNLSPALDVMGFENLLRCKGGEVPEGEALFFRRSKFELISQHDVVLSEALLTDPSQELILDHVSAMPILLETLQKRNSVVQVSLLKVVGLENRFLYVANTHLYFKPDYPHIRMLQAAIILNHIEKIMSQLRLAVSKTSDQDSKAVSACTVNDAQPKVALLFCGDFNSKPTAGLIELLTTGQLASSHHDWTLCKDKEEHCTTLSLSHPFNLFSACGFPPYTNYTGGFKGTLDYVFIDTTNIEVEAVIPILSEEDLSCHIALPSVVLPSDHLALVCDLKWKM